MVELEPVESCVDRGVMQELSGVLHSRAPVLSIIAAATENRIEPGHPDIPGPVRPFARFLHHPCGTHEIERERRESGATARRHEPFVLLNTESIQAVSKSAVGPDLVDSPGSEPLEHGRHPCAWSYSVLSL